MNKITEEIISELIESLKIKNKIIQMAERPDVLYTPRYFIELDFHLFQEDLDQNWITVKGLGNNVTDFKEYIVNDLNDYNLISLKQAVFERKKNNYSKFTLDGRAF